jgi:hypothetical protein
MRFTELAPNRLAAANPAFIVARINRHTMQYVENDETIEIEVEPGDGLAIYMATATSSHGEVNEARREIIAGRIEAAMRFWGHAFVIVS